MLKKINIFRFSSYSPQSLFQERKLFYQSTSTLLLKGDFLQSQSKKIKDHHLSIYCGYDPTAESLHLGNLVSIIMMVRVQQQLGLRPIFVIGGATGLIGDPSGKIQQRKLLDEQKVSNNLRGIEKDIKNVFQKLVRETQEKKQQYGIDLQKSFKAKEVLFVNNYQFYQNMNFLQFLRKIGKVFRMNSLLSKETVANRLKSQEGISFTQFSYSLIQAYDFFMLNQKYGCILQFGGSDQWGNITNGCDLVKKLSQGKKQVFGITMPLLLQKNGKKFGKSEGNALFLNQQKTPLSEVYQYFFNTSDQDVQKLLYIFTFYSPLKIKEIMENHYQNTQLRKAQRVLAEKVVSYLGEYQNLKENFFKLSSEEIKAKDKIYFERFLKGLSPQMVKRIHRNNPEVVNFPDLLFHCGIVSSKKQARREIIQKGFYINNIQIGQQFIVKPVNQIFDEFILQGQYLIIRKGKKKYFLISLGDHKL